MALLTQRTSAAFLAKKRPPIEIVQNLKRAWSGYRSERKKRTSCCETQEEAG